MTLADLTPADRDTAITGFARDVAAVCFHVIQDRERYPRGIPHTRLRLLDSMEVSECPSLPVLASIVEWALFTMRFNEKYRDLTRDELAIRAAARRLGDAISAAKEPNS